MFKHQPLGTTVSFAEGVQHIDVAVILSHGGDQISAFVVLKPTILRQSGEYFVGLGFNAGNGAKAGIVFADVHGADLASPIIDVLEQVTVQTLQVSEGVWRRAEFDFVGGDRGQFAFRLCELIVYPEPKAVNQCRGSRVTVRILGNPIFIRAQIFTFARYLSITAWREGNGFTDSESLT